MKKEVLDFILVPLGLALMAAYHALLFHLIVKQPKKTVLGLNAIYRRLWVKAMMEDPSKNGILAVQTLRNNIMASTLLATTAIMLISLIAVLMANTGGGSGMSEVRQHGIVFGDRSELGLSVKLFCILVCFLVAFLMNVQSIRYYSHASILVNVPLHRKSPSLSPEYVVRAVNRGSHFWSVGLRAFYFSLPLFLWIFGPIPMFLCSVVLVILLYFLDVSFDMGSSNDGECSKGRIDEHVSSDLDV